MLTENIKRYFGDVILATAGIGIVGALSPQLTILSKNIAGVFEQAIYTATKDFNRGFRTSQLCFLGANTFIRGIVSMVGVFAISRLLTSGGIISQKKAAQAKAVLLETTEQVAAIAAAVSLVGTATLFIRIGNDFQVVSSDSERQELLKMITPTLNRVLSGAEVTNLLASAIGAYGGSLAGRCMQRTVVPLFEKAKMRAAYKHVPFAVSLLTGLSISLDVMKLGLAISGYVGKSFNKFVYDVSGNYGLSFQIQCFSSSMLNIWLTGIAGCVGAVAASKLCVMTGVMPKRQSSSMNEQLSKTAERVSSIALLFSMFATTVLAVHMGTRSTVVRTYNELEEFFRFMHPAKNLAEWISGCGHYVAAAVSAYGGSIAGASVHKRSFTRHRSL